MVVLELVVGINLSLAVVLAAYVAPLGDARGARGTGSHCHHQYSNQQCFQSFHDPSHRRFHELPAIQTSAPLQPENYRPRVGRVLPIPSFQIDANVDVRTIGIAG